MSNQKINLSFQNYTDANFEKKGASIVECLNTVPLFKNVVPAIAVLQAASARYSAALLAAADLSRNNIAEKNESREALELLLYQAGLYVMNTCNGSKLQSVQSGFDLRKENEISYISNPGMVTLINGITTGELISSVVRVPFVKSYLHEITDELPTETTVWISKPASTCKYTFTNLQPGKQYWVRVGAIGSRNQLAYSPVATQIIQIIGK
jgi:hypothetical protein